MGINTKIHSKALIIKSIIGKLEFILWRPLNYFDKNDLIVLNYHSTPKKFIGEFKEQLLFLQKHFNIISPKNVDAFFTDTEKNANKPRVLLTFDDGLLNNLNAISVLNELNLKGLFFIVPEFINSKNPKEYYLTKIRDFINSNIDSLEEDFVPMSWEQIKDIVKDGHEVGSHSMTHSMKATFNDDQMIQEIVESNNRIERNIGSRAIAFCAPNNSLFSVNGNAMRMIVDNYDYFYSTFPGSNLDENNPHFILRSNVECFWPMGSLMHAIGKIERNRWKSKRVEFKETIIKDANGQN